MIREKRLSGRRSLFVYGGHAVFKRETVNDELQFVFFEKYQK